MASEQGNASIAPAGRVALVSGANRGIGRAVAERLYRDGYTLSLGAREPKTLAPLLAPMSPARVLAHAYDARDAASARDWAAATQRRFGRIDAVVCNAGVIHALDLEGDDETGLDAMWEVNAKGPLRLVRAAWAPLRAAGSGRVVVIASLSGLRVKSAAIAGYAMSKHAAVALVHGIRHAGWDDGVRATAVCPGYVRTDMSRDAQGIDRDAMTTPGAVAHLVASVLALPNTASVAELAVNCVLEPRC